MNSFNLYEDVLSRTWNRYYYEVEADTLEEAIEKVKDGEVDCYDSEQLYESTDDLAPEENNGSATREIYHEDEVVWDNAKLVNRGEISPKTLGISQTNCFTLWNLNQKSLVQAVFRLH